ncbi:polysaccharide deacetylase family protein [Ureibacillus sp. FSL K6-8385]|uniref:Polysaccharide deacetylase family protein n=1 Tax=Ureibacillus terrenus TaxID=118246 RepID=A0A540V599_9BACL|nr:polysaccharide deacetylase family protein [Ureibacillus terrenus]MED3661137.1 polysaccharide deacetylase family protein [Ureibacillus terrenus]MED3764385.1 polysaccharide deacetylase family protein [Ureibacillus terrenus]TQE91940.1 polysaccharide deacetylase family protein [Ureibacillus terrenus]
MKRRRKSKRGAWIDSLLIGSIITLTTMIIITTFMTGHFKFQQPTVSATTKYPVETSSLIEERSTAFADIPLISETSANKLISYSLEYPKTPFNQVNGIINQYIEQVKNDYINTLVEMHKAGNNHASGDLNISTDIYDWNRQYYSIVLKKRLSLDQDSSHESFKTIVFHKDTGDIVESGALLNQNTEYFHLLANYLRSELKKTYGKDLLEEKLDDALSDWDDLNRFAIMNDSIAFYFNQGEVAQELAGSAVINIPTSFLNPILATDFQNGEASKVTILTPKKKVALTFDDGPHPQVTKQILDILEKHNAKATFFMLGKQVEKNRDIALEVLNRGHEIGNHSYNHPVLTKQTTSQTAWQIDHTSKVIHDVTGEYPTVFRPPYGATNRMVESVVEIPVVLWTIDTYDWKYRDPNKLLPFVQAKLHDGAIILMHDIHQSTADGLESVLTYLEQEGYECVTVSEILAKNNR